jgi:hypothetical protein
LISALTGEDPLKHLGKIGPRGVAGHRCEVLFSTRRRRRGAAARCDQIGEGADYGG